MLKLKLKLKSGSRFISRFIIILIASVLSFPVYAQSPFSAPTIRKVTKEEREYFSNQFGSIKWTGAGLYEKAPIDYIPTMELRARLQKAFGNPTQRLEDLIDKIDFRPGECIQFEYWFIVNDSIPMMILDVDGPFDNGLTYGGASRFIDLMPEVKRTFSKILIDVKELADFDDYFYSPEDDRLSWYRVAYKNGEFLNKKIDKPIGLREINFDNKRR
ncbi:MAG: hypothetical protein GW809_02505 [Bacteroidetes bacterium]|nr:hypothetical protein [Bacteroidota bacterium]NCQ11023.1 hypothetical protein [Bacteroidota bacterium]